MGIVNGPAFGKSQGFFCWDLFGVKVVKSQRRSAISCQVASPETYFKIRFDVFSNENFRVVGPSQQTSHIDTTIGRTKTLRICRKLDWMFFLFSSRWINSSRMVNAIFDANLMTGNLRSTYGAHPKLGLVRELRFKGNIELAR